jgi:hypothetical protein
MQGLNQVLLILHFIGLAIGFSVSISNIVMSGLIAKAAPNEKAILGRFPPVMAHVGSGGLVLLWVTGLTMVFTKWNGFGSMPWQFHVKLTAVVLLTLTVGYIHRLMKQARLGDTSAPAKLQAFGKMATLFALTAVIFAVLTFE